MVRPVSDPASRLSIELDGDRLVVVGDIDAHTCPDLAARLEPLPGSSDVSLDLSGVSFMDSSGLRVIIGAHQQATEANRRVVVERPSASVLRLIEISGLLDHLHVITSD